MLFFEVGRLAQFFSVGVASGTIHFSETFGDGWESRWTASKWKESEGTQGTWTHTAGKWFADEAADKGIQTVEDSKFFGISAGFDSFSNKGKDLIIQYQAKYEKDVECGGGYVKIGPKQADLSTFGDPTPYNIMFGPDKCGYNKRTHLIFNYDGKNVLKKSDLEYRQDDEGTSHLYTLIVKPDNTVRVEIDQEKIYEGSLKEDWEILKPKKISDPDDKKPEDWDDEEDGEWEPPMKDNADYKGEWFVKRISNPAYKGVWTAKEIDNPEYKDDDELYSYEDFGFIGFDLWQVKGGTIFDNVIICDDKAEADAFAAKWKALSEHEKAEKKKDEDSKKENDKKKEDEKDDDDDDDDDDLDEEKKDEA